MHPNTPEPWPTANSPENSLPVVTPPDSAALAVPNSEPSPAPGGLVPELGANAAPHAEAENYDPDAFAVNLDVFSGPFDLLLSLISKHRLDITEVALARVTDDFIAFVTDRDWPLEESSEFLVIAATLLDLKAARLLPSGEVEDPVVLARLEARDLLFARLLQYRAFREVAEQFHQTFENLRDAARIPAAQIFECLMKLFGDLTKCAVLQQPRKQQVPRLESGQVFGVFHLPRRQ